MRPGPSSRAGFTLAEVAVTLLIVSIGLVLVLQGLSTAKVSAAETHYRKVARELALLTLGRVEAGLFWEELDGDGSTLTGSYAEEGYEEFHYELVFGEEDFSDRSEGYDRQSSYHDSWEYERERERERREREHESSKEEEEQVEEPFEKVRIRVEYPRMTERESTLTLERWIPWEQVYGGEDGEAPAAEPEDSPE